MPTKPRMGPSGIHGTTSSFFQTAMAMLRRPNPSHTSPKIVRGDILQPYASGTLELSPYELPTTDRVLRCRHQSPCGGATVLAARA
jgi:hypothetical protein